MDMRLIETSPAVDAAVAERFHLPPAAYSGDLLAAWAVVETILRGEDDRIFEVFEAAWREYAGDLFAGREAAAALICYLALQAAEA